MGKTKRAKLAHQKAKAQAVNSDFQKVAPLLSGLLQGPEGEVNFYRNLQRLQDVILSGTHPLYKFSSHDIASLAPPSIGNNGFTHSRSNVGLPSSPSLKSTGLEDARTQHQTHDLSASERSLPQAYKPLANGGLSSRSTDLVRAELRLKRQRAEKYLKESAKKRSKNGHGYNDDNAVTSLDVGKAFASAIARVPPESGTSKLAAPADNASASSFGTSHYSSRGASCTPDIDAPATITEPAAHSSVVDHNKVILPSTVARVSGLGPGKAKSTGVSATISMALDAEPAYVAGADNSMFSATELDDMREDSYSPPAADAFPSLGGADSRGPTDADLPQGAKPFAGFTAPSPTSPLESDADVESISDYSPPPAAAPQFGVTADDMFPTPPPEAGLPDSFGGGSRKVQETWKSKRIAGLAPQKQSKQQRQNKKKETRKQRKAAEREAARRAATGQQALPSDLDDSTGYNTRSPKTWQQYRARQIERNAQARRHMVVKDKLPLRVSPEFQIKQEPVSPPPGITEGTNVARRIVLRPDGGANIEIVPTKRKSRAQPATHFGQHHPALTNTHTQHTYSQPQPVYALDSPTSAPSSARRVVSRDGNDLRRLASLQQAARPQPPLPEVLYRYADGTVVAAPGQAQVVNHEPDLRQTLALDKEYPSARPQQQYQHSQSNGCNGFEAPTRAVSSAAVPPKERIIVDEEGNEYVAIPRHSYVATPAPPVAQRPLPNFETATLSTPVPYPQRRAAQQSQRPVLPYNVINIEDSEDEHVAMPPPPKIPRQRTRANGHGRAGSLLAPSPCVQTQQHPTAGVQPPNAPLVTNGHAQAYPLVAPSPHLSAQQYQTASVHSLMPPPVYPGMQTPAPLQVMTPYLPLQSIAAPLPPPPPPPPQAFAPSSSFVQSTPYLPQLPLQPQRAASIQPLMPPPPLPIYAPLPPPPVQFGAAPSYGPELNITMPQQYQNNAPALQPPPRAYSTQPVPPPVPQAFAPVPQPQRQASQLADWMRQYGQ